MRNVIERGMQMREVKVKRAELLAKIKENRLKHIAEFKEAVIGYKAEASKAIDKAMLKLKRSVEELQAGEVLRLEAVAFNLVVPQNHSRDYDQVIAMLEMSVDEQLTIRSDEFACYVMDDWGWKEEFSNTATMYKSR